MQFHDALTLDAPLRTSDGYLQVRAKAARLGVYDYAGHEVDPQNKHGLRDAATVKVLRDEQTVFDAASAKSFIGKPITTDHPAVAVNASNWRDHARGVVMGALRDGDYLSFDLLFTDQAAIDAIDNGKRELSNGYAAELEFGDFKAADGTACQARQVSIRGNHVALVDTGRAGPECAIKDAKFALCDSNAAVIAALTTGNTMKTITLDGLPVNLGDAAAVEAAITKLTGQVATLTTAKDAAETQIATLTTDKATLTAENATLKQQVADAKLTPAQLRDAAKAYAQVCDKAKALGVTVADDADEPAIMLAVVDAKLGDAAKDWTDVQIAASFATLTADAKAEVANINPAVNVGDAAAKEAAALKTANDSHNAWRNQA